MSPWRNKFTALLAVVSFVLGFAACEIACASGDDHNADDKTAQHHCVVHCACHSATVISTTSTEAVPPTDGREFVLASVSFDSRLVAASIFHPPRA